MWLLWLGLGFRDIGPSVAFGSDPPQTRFQSQCYGSFSPVQEGRHMLDRVLWFSDSGAGFADGQSEQSDLMLLRSLNANL